MGLFISNGTSALAFPTLGDITGRKIVMSRYIDIADISIPESMMLFPSIMGDDLASAEFGVMKHWTGGLFTYLGGGNSGYGDFETILGGTHLVGELSVTIEINGDVEFKLNGATLTTGTAIRGAARIDGALVIDGGRSEAVDGGSSALTWMLPTGTKLGDCTITLDDTDVYTLVMNEAGDTGTVVQGTYNDGATTVDWDGALISGTLDGSDWETTGVAQIGWTSPTPLYAPTVVASEVTGATLLTTTTIPSVTITRVSDDLVCFSGTDVSTDAQGYLEVVATAGELGNAVTVKLETTNGSVEWNADAGQALATL